MQYSQEHLKTMVYAKFGGQTECIMGNWKIENLKTLSVGPAGVRTPHHKVQMKIHFSSCYLCCVNKCVNSMLHLDNREICNYFFDRNSQAIY